MRYIVILAGSVFLMSAAHVPSLQGEDCGCGTERAACYKCCPKKCRKCCPTRVTRSMPTMFQRAAPPFGPVVESVPVISSPLLMSQDRYVVSTTRLRALEAAPRSVSPRDLGCAASSRDLGCDAAGSRSPDDRLGNLERDVQALAEQMSMLKATLKEQNASLELIKNKLTNP